MSNGTDPGWNGEDRRRSSGNGSALERHITTALATLMTLLTAWIGLSTIDLGKEQVKTSTQLQQVREDMRQLQDQYIRSNADRYTASEARRDMATIMLQVQKIEDRLERVERTERRK